MAAVKPTEMTPFCILFFLFFNLELKENKKNLGKKKKKTIVGVGRKQWMNDKQNTPIVIVNPKIAVSFDTRSLAG